MFSALWKLVSPGMAVFSIAGLQLVQRIAFQLAQSGATTETVAGRVGTSLEYSFAPNRQVAISGRTQRPDQDRTIRGCRIQLEPLGQQRSQGESHLGWLGRFLDGSLTLSDTRAKSIRQ